MRNYHGIWRDLSPAEEANFRRAARQAFNAADTSIEYDAVHHPIYRVTLAELALKHATKDLKEHSRVTA